MKSLARGHVWWPGMDKAIEDMAKSCTVCQTYQKAPPKAPLHPWEWPHQPWSRLHIDYAGLFMGKMFLLIIDAHSKWLEVHVTNSCTTQSTVDKLRMTFANHGLPEMVVSDNGPAFNSKEFEEFMRKNGIQHVKSAPYHPSTNGLVERAVQTFKNAMKKQNGTLQTRLSRFLFKYRITPHTTTGVSPAELRWGTKLRTHLSLVQPDLGRTVRYAQHKQKKYCDEHVQSRTVSIDDDVFVKNYASPKVPWVSGKVVESTGPISAKVALHDGRIIRRHQDQISLSNMKDSSNMVPDETQPSNSTVELPVTETQMRRYPERERRKPKKFDDYELQYVK